MGCVCVCVCVYKQPSPVSRRVFYGQFRDEFIRKAVTQRVLVPHPTSPQTKKNTLCFLAWIKTLLSLLSTLLSMRHQRKKNGKYNRGGGWRDEGEKKRKKEGAEEGMQVWGLTSEQYSLKNLSSTTNKDTRPELYLIIAAYSPWLCLQLGTHQ